MTSTFIHSHYSSQRTLIRTANKGQRPLSITTNGRQRLSDDTVGVFNLVLVNIVRGSSYRVERVADGSLATPTILASGVVPAGAGDTTTVTLELNYYSTGNQNNNLRIKVRKASTVPYYRAFESIAVAQSGTVTVYCSQEID